MPPPGSTNKHSIIGGSRGCHRALLSTGSTLHTASLVDPGVAQSFVIPPGSTLHTASLVDPGGGTELCYPPGSTIHTAVLKDPGGGTELCATPWLHYTHSIIGGSRGWHRALLSTGSTLHTASLVDPGGGTELCYPLAPLYTQHHWWIQGVAQSFVIHWLHSTHSAIGGSRRLHRGMCPLFITMYVN